MARSPSPWALPLLLACADAPPPPEHDAQAEPSVTRPVPADSLNAALFERGRSVYQTICSECHVFEPPPLTAPALREIVSRYRAAYQERAEGIEHLADYIREPAPTKSILPQVTLDEWGVMPPQPLPDEDLRAAAYFIWHLPDTTSAR